MDAGQFSSGALQAGAAQVDITPHVGISLSGNVCIRRPAQFVQDPLHARALVLKAGEAMLCLISMDLCIVTREWNDEIRRQVGEALGIDPAGVTVHNTQCHSAPSLGHANATPLLPPELSWAQGGDDDYHPFAIPRIVEAARLAHEALQPAAVGAASLPDGRMAYNRRWIMRDGTVRQSPMGSPDLLYPEGPADPEVGIVCLVTPELRILAMLLHYTCHPIHGLRLPHVSADWPGAWAHGMREAFGEDVVPLVINGCCGNVNPLNPVDPNWTMDCARMGGQLIETSHRVLEKMGDWRSKATLGWCSRHLSLKPRRFPDKDVVAAHRMIEEHPDPIWDNDEHTRVNRPWLQAVSCLHQEKLLQEDPDFRYDYEVQAVRVGDIGLVAVPGEPFVEGQLEIKQRSPFRLTYVAHHCHSEVGLYLPARKSFEREGGHETTPHTARVEEGALEMMVETSLELLGDAFARDA